MRIVYRMDPDWRFHIGDPQEQAKNHSAVYNSTKSGGIAGPATKNVFDDSEWEHVDLPHDYLREAPFSPDALGNHGYRVFCDAWYRKTFQLNPALAGSHVLLVFDGIATSAEIFFNGSRVRRSFSGYAEIAIDLTDRVYFDRVNTLAVYTRADAINGWWYEGAGIYRHVHLYCKPLLHIAHNGIYANPKLKKGEAGISWCVPVQVTLENSGYEPAETSVFLRLSDGDLTVASAQLPLVNVPANGTYTVFSELTVENPRLWDIDSPHLYSLTVETKNKDENTDSDTVNIGFRAFRFDPDHGFFLNGRHLIIKGTCNHQDHAGVGVAVPDSIQEYRLRRLKEMGCNAYRCSHNPPAREILDACDRFGLLVMDENRDFEASAEALGYLETMIRRDRNHPSILCWSLFNEETLQNSAEGKSIFKRQKALVRLLDDRPVIGAVNDRLRVGGTGDEMDILGVNYSLQSVDISHAAFPDKPILGTENNSAVTTRGCYKTDREGAQILNNYDEEVVPWGCTIRKMWKFVHEHPYFCGIFVWTGFDYRGEPTPFVWPSVSSQFGILDTCGFPKDAYYFTRAVWCEEPMIHLLPHWNHLAGETVRVMTVSNCTEVELFCNGKSLGRRKNDPCEQNEWQVLFEPGVLSAVGYRAGKAVVKTERITAGKAVAIRLLPDRSTLHNAGGDTVPVRVSVVDGNGVEIPDANDRIRFTVTGDGINAGVGNGDPNSHEPDRADQRRLYCGLCQVLVMANRGAKKLGLRAEADGLRAAELTFVIENRSQPNELFFAPNRAISGITASVVDSPEKPDPTRPIGDDDMNSFAPVTIENRSLRPSGFQSGWRELRLPVSLPSDLPLSRAAIEMAVVVAGRVECYVDGNPIFVANEPPALRPLVIPLAKAGKPHFEVRMLIRAKEGADYSGLSQGISLVGKD